MTEQNDRSHGEWEDLARSLGWVVAPADPAGSDLSGPILYHEGLDRVWPLADPQGACRDVGWDETDMEDTE